MTSVSHPTQLTSLPTELLIDTVSSVSWTAFELKNLKLVCRGFNDVLSKYEHSIASRLIHTQIPWSILHRFPDLVQVKRGHGYSYYILEDIQSRWKLLECIEKSCHDVKERNSKQAKWMTPRRVMLQGIGLCLLYRLYNAGNHKDRAALIRSLPIPSLAVLVFTLTMSIHQLSANGPDILNVHAPVQCAAFRAEIELACKELILHHGPGFLKSLLENKTEEIRMLEKEYDSMEERQMPYQGEPKPPTLIAVLQRTLSMSLDCNISDSHKLVLDLLEGDRFKVLSEDEVSKIIQGENIQA